MMWWRRNWRWFLFGSLAWGSLLGIGLATFYPVWQTLWPSGPPLDIMKVEFERREITTGQWQTLRIVANKDRQCYAVPNLVFVDSDDRETQFLFSDWPQLPNGRHEVRVRTRAPAEMSLQPGTYRYQVRLSFTCPNGGYNVASPFQIVELVTPPAQLP